MVGSVPGGVGELTELITLVLHTNALGSTLPPEIAQLTKLEVLDLGANALTGSVPGALSQLSSLTYLSLVFNDLTGRLPELPFGQYAGCFLQSAGKFACPLPANASQCVGTASNPDSAPQCVPCTGSSSDLTQSDCAAFQAIFDATGGVQWTHCNSSRNDPCSCSTASTGDITKSVRCSGERITWISLDDNAAAGTLPRAVSDLTMLTLLSFTSSPSLVGTIPTELSKLENIQTLCFAYNALSGSIPASLARLSKLEYLRVDGNRLTGIVPLLPFAQYKNSCCLQSTHKAGGNHYKCPLPSHIDQCAPDASWTCSTNIPCSNCTGASDGLPQSECLAWIAVFDSTGGEHWTGSEHPRNDPCANTGRVVCTDDDTDPGVLHITSIHLHDAKIAGTLPNLSSFTALTRLDVHTGYGASLLSGIVPADLSALTQLTRLELCGTHLSGPVPDLAALTKLTYLDLSNNLLTGVLPALPFAQYTFCKLQNRNGLTTNSYACPLPANATLCVAGPPTCSTPTPTPAPSTPAPTPASNCTAASARLPQSECLAWIAVFDATGGQNWHYFSDRRSDPCGAISNNTGGRYNVCADIDGVTHITHLVTNYNNMHGTLPWSQVSKLTALSKLGLWGNILTGAIAGTGLSKLTALESILLYRNSFTGTLPVAAFLKLTKLTSLSFGYNQLSGTISPDLAQLTSLTHLWLNNNSFQSFLPELPFSNYSGGKACGLENIPFACPLPPGAAICAGRPTCSTPTPPAPTPTPPTIARPIVPIVAGACLVSIIVAAAGIAKKRQLEKKRKAGASLSKPLLARDGDDSMKLLRLKDGAAFDIETGAPANADAQQLCVWQWRAGEADSVRELPYVDIEEAAGGFGVKNRLASGGSCTVFKGELYGLPVAVKQLQSDADDWNNAQFESEMRTLCIITHAHICALLAFSTDGPQRCLVLELCDGGALDTRIACRAVGGGAVPDPLHWRHRLTIALGVASALEHLHSLRPQLLHR
jgi:Leucine-rich repeat (LRR) protein